MSCSNNDATNVSYLSYTCCTCAKHIAASLTIVLRHSRQRFVAHESCNFQRHSNFSNEHAACVQNTTTLPHLRYCLVAHDSVSWSTRAVCSYSSRGPRKLSFGKLRSVAVISTLYGIHKCTSVEVATWAGSLAKESPAYPPVELLIRTVWRGDGTTVRPNEVLFACSTLIGRDVPFKVFKRWALRDRTPMGPLLRPLWEQRRSLTRDTCC